MQIFSRFQNPYHWYYVTPENITTLLSTPPYRQDDKIYALCPYCFNPVQMILKNTNNQNDGVYYAKHLQQHSPFINWKIDQERLENCILRKKSRLLTKGAVSAKFNTDDLDVNKVRKAMFYLLHVSMSNEFVQKLIKKTDTARYYTFADKHNFAFMMLLEMKYLLLNNRILSSHSMLLNAIQKKSKYCYLSKINRVIARDAKARLYFIFNGQGISEHSKLNYLSVKVVEERNNTEYSKEIYRFKVYIKGFKNLLLERTHENEDYSKEG